MGSVGEGVRVFVVLKGRHMGLPLPVGTFSGTYMHDKNDKLFILLLINHSVRAKLESVKNLFLSLKLFDLAFLHECLFVGVVEIGNKLI